MNLNGNLRIEFLKENILNMVCLIKKIETLHHPLTKQHIGLAIFEVKEHHCVFQNTTEPLLWEIS